ncbi:hypothetical protein O181_013245 [Austropuccinia psidii MF-1]|uniref:Uncharacterized protein n=1 Tax=Austropuccinia psidii MF-1 TaxID=1389203 RepID=A0A9Q3GNQ9_9BASI|nr:hypothetical protein [Austropuccinia psidii MF-1]
MGSCPHEEDIVEEPKSSKKKSKSTSTTTKKAVPRGHSQASSKANSTSHGTCSQEATQVPSSSLKRTKLHSRNVKKQISPKKKQRPSPLKNVKPSQSIYVSSDSSSSSSLLNDSQDQSTALSDHCSSQTNSESSLSCRSDSSKLFSHSSLSNNSQRSRSSETDMETVSEEIYSAPEDILYDDKPCKKHHLHTKHASESVRKSTCRVDFVEPHPCSTKITREQHSSTDKKRPILRASPSLHHTGTHAAKIHPRKQKNNFHHESSPTPIHDLYGVGYEYAYRPTQPWKPLQQHQQQHDQATPKPRFFKPPSACVDSDDLEFAEKGYEQGKPDSSDNDGDQLPTTYHRRKESKPMGVSSALDPSACFVPAAIPFPLPNNSAPGLNYTAYSQLRSTYQPPKCNDSPILPSGTTELYKHSMFNEYSPFTHTSQSIQKKQNDGQSFHVYQPGPLLTPTPIPLYPTGPPHTAQPQGTSTHLDYSPFSQTRQPAKSQPTKNSLPPSSNIQFHERGGPKPFDYSHYWNHHTPLSNTILSGTPMFPTSSVPTPAQFRRQESRHIWYQQSPPENFQFPTTSTFPNQSTHTTLNDFPSTSTCPPGQGTTKVPHCKFLFHQPLSHNKENSSSNFSSIPNPPFSQCDNRHSFTTPKIINELSTPAGCNVPSQETVDTTAIKISEAASSQCHEYSFPPHNLSNSAASTINMITESSKRSTITTEKYSSNPKPLSNKNDESNVILLDSSNEIPKTSQISTPLQPSIFSKKTFDLTPSSISKVVPSQSHESTSTTPKPLTCTVNATNPITPSSMPSTTLPESLSQANTSSVKPTQSFNINETPKAIVLSPPPLNPTLPSQESFYFTTPISEVTSTQYKESSFTPSTPSENMECAASTILSLSKPMILPPKNNNIQSFCITPPSKLALPFNEITLDAKQKHPFESKKPTDAPLQKLEKKVRFTTLEHTNQAQSMESISAPPLKQPQATSTYLPENARKGLGSHGCETSGESKLPTTQVCDAKKVARSPEDEELEAAQKILSDFLGDYGPQLESDSQQPNENLTDSSTKCPQDATSVPPPSSSTHSSKDSAINAVHPVLPIRRIAPLQKRTPTDAPPVLQNTIATVGKPLPISESAARQSSSEESYQNFASNPFLILAQERHPRMQPSMPTSIPQKSPPESTLQNTSPASAMTKPISVSSKDSPLGSVKHDERAPVIALNEDMAQTNAKPGIKEEASRCADSFEADVACGSAQVKSLHSESPPPSLHDAFVDEESDLGLRPPQNENSNCKPEKMGKLFSMFQFLR